MRQEYFESLGTIIPGVLEFYGTEAAELFTKEIRESLKGVLEKSFICNKKNLEDNFVTTSIDGRVCSDHLWSRDAGTLMRELVQWGYLGYACCLSNILLNLVDKNQEGYYTFPMYFLRGQKASGSELDGTGSVLISFVLLWKRLTQEHPMRKRIYNFLVGDSSPVKYIVYKLEKEPLIKGSGEFGGGMFIEGEYYNVVQNYLVYLTLKSVEGMMRECENTIFADLCLKNAVSILSNIEKYLISEDGSWLWCIDPENMRSDESVLNSEANKGFGGINGVIAMYADVFGFELPGTDWIGVKAAKKSFEKLFSEKLRREQYEKYGIWTQFDILISGLLTSPSYGQGYALQASLLFDRLDITDKLIEYLAKATYIPPEGYKLDRDSRYYFYERYLSPDFKEIKEFDQGCGALNLVNVAEPLKVARMIAGIDDSTDDILKIIPRIPVSWTGFTAKGWQVYNGKRLVKADISFEKKDKGYIFKFVTYDNELVSNLELVLINVNGCIQKNRFINISKIEFEIDGQY